ncbi:MAG: response regulator, partial [Desulfobacteraceae bacterium]
AKNGKEAVEKFEKYKDEIDLVILDMVMPDLSGEEVFDLLKEIKPDVKVLLASGHTFNNRTKTLIDRGCIGFIKKPYRIEELSKRLTSIKSVPSKP